MIKCRNCALMLQPRGFFCHCCGAALSVNDPTGGTLYGEFHESEHITEESKYGRTVKAQVFRCLVGEALQGHSEDWQQVFAQTIKANQFTLEEIAAEVEARKEVRKEFEPVMKRAEATKAQLSKMMEKYKETTVETSPGLRAQVFEVIVRQALEGFPWEMLCKEPMQTHSIEPDEIKAEVERRQAAASR